MEFGVPAELAAQMVAKGSVAIDGISLTLVEVSDGGFSVFVIPHTFETTTLGSKRAGDAVNVETDLLGKYVARYLARLAGNKSETATGGGLTEEKLREHGFA